MLKKLILLLLLCFRLPAFAQVNVQFIAETNGRNLNGLLNCHVISQFQRIAATLVITVTERQAGTVCRISTPEFTLLPGDNRLPLAAARGAAIQFGDNRLGQMTGLNRTFPEGDYDYCYEFSFSHSDNPPFEQCFSYALAPFAELNLVDPYDEDVICDKRPLLTWQPLIPAVAGARYRLTLAEIKTGQSATEALNYNLLLIDQANLVSPVLTYPSVAKELQNKKKYAWQVTAYVDQTILNRSEIWAFTVDCRDSLEKAPDPFAFREIEDLLLGNSYVARGSIKFALRNPYAAQRLKYTIRALDYPDKKIHGLPAVKLLNGANFLVIDLTGNGAFQKNRYYVMDITMPDGTVKSLRFLYDE
jgi:hypothetical protein